MKAVDKLKGILADLAGASREARDGIAKLRAVDIELRAEDERIAAEIATQTSALPPKADIIAAGERQVDALGEGWRQAYGPRILAAIAGRLDVRMDGEVSGIVPGDMTAFGLLPQGLDLHALAGIAPGFLKAGLRDLVQATTYEAGPRLEERPARIAELQARRRGIHAQHRAMVDEAAAAGVTLADLPENVALRHREARDRQAIDDYNSLNARAIARGSLAPASTYEQAR